MAVKIIKYESEEQNSCVTGVNPVRKLFKYNTGTFLSSFDVKWNFNKFMISENGEWQGYLPSKIKPDDRIIINWIMDR